MHPSFTRELKKCEKERKNRIEREERRERITTATTSLNYRKLSFYALKRPYHLHCVVARPSSEVKQRRARIAVGWETAWERRSSSLLRSFKSMQN